ncbi:MAG: MazG family protein [Anaerolineales bacterium]|nr:MazG family protein [Anaerolineales bacterium]
MPHITIVGLGPGDPDLLTRAAWDALSAASDVYLRTNQHPVVTALPAHLVVHSFDAEYARADEFADVYAEITRQVISLGSRPEGVVYAVPGDPAIGEATTWLIRAAAGEANIPVRVIHGVSFVEPACLALGLDPLEQDGLQVLDAMVAASSHVPPFDTSRPALLAQCYSRALASDVKLTLLHSFPETHPVTVLRAAAGGPSEASLATIPLFELDHSTAYDHLTTLYVPPAGPQASFNRLQEIVAHLRAPDGCPWDREQTVQTLRKDLLEEIYELVEALDEDDDVKMAEELGDAALLLTMIAQIGAEEERFQWPQVMTQIVEKLIRRHPHVFGDVEVASVDEVLSNWAAIKDVERGVESGERPVSPFDSVPRALPALMLAGKYQSRLARAGLEPSLDGANPLGRQLWDLVTEAKAGGMDAETALREVCEQVAAHVDAR